MTNDPRLFYMRVPLPHSHVLHIVFLTFLFFFSLLYNNLLFPVKKAFYAGQNLNLLIETERKQIGTLQLSDHVVQKIANLESKWRTGTC